MADPDIPLDNFPSPNGHSAPKWEAEPVSSAVDIAASLREKGLTPGLVKSLQVNKAAFALSIWVIDNSGSMNTNDGHRIVELSAGSALKLVECSRWVELQQAVDYHAQMAALLEAPTTFRLLNDPGCIAGPQVFSIATDGGGSIDHDLSVAVATIQNSQAGGVTPLTQQIQAVRQTVLAMQPQLRQNGTKVAVVLATDGLPTDSQGNSDSTITQEFVDALRSLEDLPVWVVVRLCTDQAEVVQFWNDLDSRIELSLEVLDDYDSEAQELNMKNPWLTYGFPLHRMREMGFYHPLFDALDERKLSKDDVRDFMRILFGNYDAPDPMVDWKGFCDVVKLLVAKEKEQWNPVHEKMMPWIDVDQLYSTV
jgi:Mg-chelatase subunit ChlD